MSGSSQADLSGATRLAERAETQFDTLKAEAASLLEEHPPSLFIERGEADDILRVRIPEPPPEDWELDVGQMADNARAALDHLVYELAIDSGNDPKGKRTQFPIFESKQDYFRKRGGRPSWRESMLEGVKRRHRKVIDGLQPWKLGRKAVNDPLSILRSVTDRHKHRELHAGIAFLETYEITIELSEPAPGSANPMFSGAELQVTLGSTDESKPLSNGDELYALPRGVGPPESELPDQGAEVYVPSGLRVSAPPVFTIAFTGDRLVKLSDLERSIRRVSEIVARFKNRIAR